MGSNPVRSKSMFAKRLSSSMGLAVVIIFAKGSDDSAKALMRPFVEDMDVGSIIPARFDDVMGILLCKVCVSKADEVAMGNDRVGAALLGC